MFWVYLWKFVFIATVFLFGMMALWVTVQGARDIVWLLTSLRKRHEHKDKTAQESLGVREPSPPKRDASISEP